MNPLISTDLLCRRSGHRRAPSDANLSSSRGFHGALSWLFPVQLSAVAEESFVRNRGNRDAGTGDRGDDGDLQPGECRAAEAAALSGAGPADADYAGGPLVRRCDSGVAE